MSGRRAINPDVSANNHLRDTCLQHMSRNRLMMLSPADDEIEVDISV